MSYKQSYKDLLIKFYNIHKEYERVKEVNRKLVSCGGGK